MAAIAAGLVRRCPEDAVLLDNLKLGWKFAIPLIVLFATMVGMVAYSSLALRQLTDGTATIVDVYAARRGAWHDMTNDVGLVTSQVKNVIIVTAEEDIAHYRGLYEAAKAATFRRIDLLDRLSSNAEVLAGHAQLRDELRAAYVEADRSIAFAAKNDNANAFKVLLENVNPRLDTVMEQSHAGIAHASAEFAGQNRGACNRAQGQHAACSIECGGTSRLPPPFCSTSPSSRSPGLSPQHSAAWASSWPAAS